MDVRAILTATETGTGTGKGGQPRRSRSQSPEDYLSDRYLPTDPAPGLRHTRKRARTPSPPLPLREAEQAARQAGLERDLLAEAEIIAGGGQLPPEDADGHRMWDQLPDTGPSISTSTSTSGGADGTRNAMRMMLAMGYRRGRALGKAQEEQTQQVEEEQESEPDEDEQDTEQRTHADSGALLAGGTEPLLPDQRWLARPRGGIGSIRAKLAPPPTPAAAAAAAPASADDFRSRLAATQRARHTAALLTRARSTLHSLDAAAGVPYSPLWIDAPLATYLAGSSAHPDSDTTDTEALRVLEAATETDQRTQQARQFIYAAPDVQLHRTLEALRNEYHYCLFCGTQYKDQVELDQFCPGTEEDDHD